MSDIKEQFTQYLEQNLPQKEINSFSQCLQFSLTTFKHYVKGKQENTYTPEELRDFMHQFILKENYINDTLLHQLMQFKTAVVGGTTDHLTNKEIDDIIVAIGVSSKVIDKNYPFKQNFIYSRKHISTRIKKRTHYSKKCFIGANSNIQKILIHWKMQIFSPLS